MVNIREKSAAAVQVQPATPGDQPIIANLLQLYSHDFSEFHPLELEANGRFEYPDLPLYFTEPDHYAFLITVNGRLAGMALIRKKSEILGGGSAWDMAEFFIVRGYRRQGIGARAAYQLWKRFPGRWQIRVMPSNPQALQFWRHAIAAFQRRPVSPRDFENHGRKWYVFVFSAESQLPVI